MIVDIDAAEQLVAVVGEEVGTVVGVAADTVIGEEGLLSVAGVVVVVGVQHQEEGTASVAGEGVSGIGYQSRGIHEHISTYIIPAIPIIPWWRLLQHRLLLLKRKCRGDGYPCPWRSLSLWVTMRARISPRERLLLWLRLLIPIPILRRALLPRR